MKERPILFSGPMVQAILDGRKTQTRRVVRLPKGCLHDDVETASAFWNCWSGTGRQWQCGDELAHPNYQPGDRLYVKETWLHTVADDNSGRGVVAYRADGGGLLMVAEGEGEGDIIGVQGEAAPWITAEHKWRPSIFMPRWASRITLEVTDVRVERVRDISEADAIAEGFSAEQRDNNGNCWQVTAKERFHELWDSINAKRGNGWDTDPWVWVVSFRRLES